MEFELGIEFDPNQRQQAPFIKPGGVIKMKSTCKLHTVITEARKVFGLPTQVAAEICFESTILNESNFNSVKEKWIRIKSNAVLKIDLSRCTFASKLCC